MTFEIFGYQISIEKKAMQDQELPKDLQEAIKIIEKYGKKLPPSPKKVASANKAREVLQKRTKEKIQNAINLLRLEGKEITPYRVAKTAGISFNTAKKYLHNMTSNQNE